MRRLNITLPDKLVERIENQANKSAFIAEALSEKLAAVEKKLRDSKLALAYLQSKEEEKGLNDEWDASAGDGL